MTVEADVVPGTEVEGLIDRLCANPEVAYIHVHNAKQGCYSGRIDRSLASATARPQRSEESLRGV